MVASSGYCRSSLVEVTLVQKRDNDYYLQRFKKERPDLFQEIQAGRLNVNKARQIAGLGGVRTRLQELKNAWSKATPAQQADFLSWALPGVPSASTGATVPSTPLFGTAWKTDGRMLDWARRRIPEIMSRRNLSYGDVADELGIKRLNASVGGAIRGDRVKSAATALAVDEWIKVNASV